MVMENFGALDILNPSSNSKLSNLNELNDPSEPLCKRERRSNRITGLHGHAYQLILLMFFLIRSIINKYTFQLTTEKKDFEKFDDIILEISKNNTKTYRLLQVKHKEDESVEISFKDLFNKHNLKGDFNLIKYYRYYQKMKNCEFFKNYTIENLMICTNIGLKLDDTFTLADTKKSVTIRECLTLVQTEDEILDLNESLLINLSKKPQRVKFNNKITEILKHILKEKVDENFFKHLVFAVDQPSEKFLSKIIKRDLREKLNIIEADYVFNSLYQYVLRWAMGFGNEYISNEQIKKLLEEMKQKICELELVGINKNYRINLDKFGIVYNLNNNEIVDMENFLNSQKQILNIETIYTNLSVIKVNQILRTISKENYLLMDVEFALNLQNRLMQAFRGSTNLLVIEYKNINNRYGTEIFCNKLSELVLGNTTKKVIFVAPSNNFLNSKIPADIRLKIDYKSENFTDLTIGSLNNILDKKNIVFQGKEIKLKSIVSLDNLRPLIYGETLYQLISKKTIEIGRELESLGRTEKYYIKRRFSRKINIKFPKRGKNPEFVIIENCENLDLDILEAELSKRENGELIVISDTIEHFEKLCENFHHLNIHWLKQTENQNYIWVRSKGCLKKLRQLIDTKITYFTPSKISDIQEKVVILTGEPGIGKSTVLTKLIIEMKGSFSSSCILRINLLNYVDLFEDWTSNPTNFNKNEVLKFLFNTMNAFDKTGNQNSIFTKFLESHSSNHNEIASNIIINESFNFLETALCMDFFKYGRINLILDGFDEIAPNYKNIVIKLIQICINFSIERLWISTRNYNILDELEDALSCFSYQLEPLILNEQMEYLKKFWADGLNIAELNENRFKVFFNELIKIFSASISNTEEEFLGIPLHTNMVAHVTQNIFKDFYESGDETISDCIKQNLQIKLDLCSLYEGFIETKLIKFFEKNDMKINSPMTQNIIREKRKQFFQSHMILAFFEIFLEKYITYYLSESEINMKNDLVKQLKVADEKIGIIVTVDNNRPRFIHRTFAEYFIARYLWEKFKSISYNEFESFMHKILHGIGGQIYKFFQSIALKDLLNRKINIIEDQLKYDFLFKELLARSILNNFTNIDIKDLWQLIECTLLNGNFNIYLNNTDAINCIKKNNDGINLLCIFAELGCVQLTKIFVKKFPIDFLKDNLKTQKWKSNSVWMAAKNNHLQIVEILSQNLHYNYGWFDMDKHTFMDFLFIEKNFDILRIFLKLNLLNIGMEFDLYDIKQLPLYRSIALKAPSDVIMLLIEKTDIARLNKYMHHTRNNYIRTLVTNFVEYDKKIIEFAIQKGLDFSNAINILLTTNTKNFDSQMISCNLPDLIKKLLECGIGYHHLDVQQGIGTLQYVQNLNDIFNLLNEVRKFCEKSYEKYDPAQVIMKLIIDGITNSAKFKGFEIIFTEHELCLQYDINQKIQLVSGDIAKDLYILQKNICFKNVSVSETQNSSKLLKIILKEKALRKYFGISPFSYFYSRHLRGDKIREKVKNFVKFLGVIEEFQNKIYDTDKNISDANIIRKIFQIENIEINHELLDLSSIIFLNGNISVLNQIFEEFNANDLQVINNFKILSEIREFLYGIHESYINFLQNIKNTESLYNSLQTKNIENLNYFINAENDENGTLLFYSIYNNDFKSTALLLSLGANHNLCLKENMYSFLNCTKEYYEENYKNCTILHLASENDAIEILKFLLDNRKFLNVKDFHERTPLHYAVRKGKYKAFKYLVDYMSDEVYENDIYGKNILHYACEFGFLDIVRHLIEVKNFQCNSQNLYGRIPICCSNEQYKIIDYKSKNEIDAFDYHIPNETFLHITAGAGHFHIIKYLIEERKFSMYDKDKFGRTPIHYAIESEKIEILDYFLEMISSKHKNTDNNHKYIYDIFIPSLLYCAVEMGNLNIIKHLIEKMKQENSKNENCFKRNLLHCAAQSGKIDVLQYIMANFPDIKFNSVDKYGDTIIHYATFSGKLELVQYLIENEICEPNSKNYQNEIPLHYAAKYNAFEILKYFIEELKIDPNIESLWNKNTLHYAVLSGSLDIVKYVVEKSDVKSNTKNYCGETVLYDVIRFGNLNILKYFMENKNFSSDIRNTSKETLFHCAVQSGKLDIVKYLIKKQLDVYAKNLDGKTSLHFASESGNLTIVKYLVEETTLNTEALCINNETPMHYASRIGALNILKYYIEIRNANFNIRNINDETILHSAVEGGKLEIVKYLLDKKYFKPNIKTFNGRTLLHYAVYSENLNIVKYFVENINLNINDIDKYGRTPLDYANESENENLINFLQNKLQYNNDNIKY
ncbi:uncharacterized protein LOC129605147 [Condylostylus longicornis]|uniref:uncharacterized protein LOC129605147 n=1 Tax=Condylostylus longicornis TaxID=2530218 RepID=UPI00244E1B0E|nr:uncharacterized protein LOC129605147 [Condylostylus longicornis]